MDTVKIIKHAKAVPQGRSFILSVHPGLGDVLVALPVAYALAEAGYNPVICQTEPENYNIKMSYPQLNDLSALPLAGETLPGKSPEFMLENVSWRWVRDTNIVTDTIADLDIENVSTPNIACLLPDQVDIDKYIQAYGRYVVCSADGHSNSDLKKLSAKQLSAIAAVCEARDYKLVIVGGDAAGLVAPKNSIDLRGHTNLSDLVAIIAGATVAVVSDSGPLHVAGAMRVPILVITPDKTYPRGALCNYWPQVTLSAKTAKAITVNAIRKNLNKLLDVAETPWCIVGPDVNPCGVSETGRIMADAAGVPYVPFEKHDGGLCVVEHHCFYMAELNKYCVPKNTVLSLHRPENIAFNDWAGVLFRSKAAERIYSPQAEHSHYVPLHSLYIADNPRQWGHKLRIMWHGIVRTSKGVEKIVDAWRIAVKHINNIELALVCSSPDWNDCPETVAWLKSIDEPGLTVKLKPDRSQNELHGELLTANCHIAFDGDDKEQSAAIPTVLGYGVPVITSKSTAFDDTRGWCLTATPDTLASEFVRLATDRQYYNDAAHRAWMGAQYRDVKILAREYRAMVQASLLGEI